MKVFKVKIGDRKFIVRAEDSITAVRKLQDIQLADDRLAPMTYKKLKDFGYTSNQWKNWTQEHANKIVASHENKANQETKKKEEQGSESKNSTGLRSVNKSQSENRPEEKSKFDFEFDNSEPPANMKAGSREIIEFYDKRRNKNANILMKNKEVNSRINSYIDAKRNNRWKSPMSNKAPEVALTARRASLNTFEKTYEELGGDRMLKLMQSAPECFTAIRSSGDNENARRLSMYAHTLATLKVTIDHMKETGLSRYKRSLYTV